MENVSLAAGDLPQSPETDEASDGTVTMPDAGAEEILIPLKFNKEIKKVSLEEASGLAQKGMKFDAIAGDYENLKSLAKNEGKSVSEYIDSLTRQYSENRAKALAERCGGDEELARHIIELENGTAGSSDMGLAELCEQVPEITGISDLPEQVVENAQIKGTRLLDEFLRYKLSCKRQASSADSRQKTAESSSVGSQATRGGEINPETAEFLKGLWK